MHIESQEFIKAKIHALRGRDARNNKLVLETIALYGPFIKYDIFKTLKSKGVKYYPTVSRRVDDLKTRGYLDIAGKRVITVGKRSEESPTYALTWRGFIASLTVKSVIKETLRVLENNSLLELPFPKGIAINVLKELFTKRQIKIITRALLEGFLRALPRDIESVEQEKYIAYIVPAIIETPEIQEKFEQKDFTKLLEIPGFLDFIWDLIDTFERNLSETLGSIRIIKKEVGKYREIIQKSKKPPIDIKPI